MEVKYGRRVKDGSENYRLMTRRIVITLLVYIGYREGEMMVGLIWQSDGYV